MVTRSQFRSALNMGHVPVAEKEFSMLCAHYNSDRNTFRYRAFCDDCEASREAWASESQVDAD